MRQKRGLLLDAEVLVKQRHLAGVTQQQLAELAGITTRTLQNAEAGQRLSSDSAHRICGALGVPLLSLVRMDPEQTRHRLSERGLAPLPPPAHVQGRGGETERVAEALDPARRGAAVVTISGLPGIGKTALARLVAQRVAPWFPDGVIWLTDQGTDLVEGASSQWLLLAEALNFAEQLPPWGSLARDAWFQLVARCVWRRRRLVVLDDLVHPELVRLLRWPDVPASLLITTARREPLADTALDLVLGGLQASEARAILAGYLAERLEDDPAATSRLLNALAGVPRALHIAGRLLQRERYLPLDADFLAASPAPEGVETLSPVFERVRELLDPQTLAALGSLTLLGRAPFTIPWAEAATGLEPLQVRRALGRLVDCFLLEELRDDEGPLLAFDAQSLRVAALIAPRDDQAQRRVLAYAATRARELVALPPPKARAALARRFPLWKGVLKAAAEEGHPLLLALLLPLGLHLAALAPRSTSAWLDAAHRQAHARQAEQGRVNNLRGLIACYHHLDFAGARASHLDAVAAFCQAGDHRRATVALFHAARMAFTRGDAPTSLAEQRRALAVAEHTPDASPALRALLEQAVGATSLFVATLPAEARVERARRHLHAALTLLPADHPMSHATRVSLQSLRLSVGLPVEPQGLPEAFAALSAAVSQDPYDLLRLRDLAQALQVDPRRIDLLAALPDLPRALLTCPRPLLGRRFIRLSESLSYLLLRRGRAQGLPAPPQLAHLDVSDLGLTDLLLDLPVEAPEEGSLPLLYPLERVEAAWSAPEVLDAARAFIQAECSAEHPLRQLIGGLEALAGEPG